MRRGNQTNEMEVVDFIDFENVEREKSCRCHSIWCLLFFVVYRMASVRIYSCLVAFFCLNQPFRDRLDNVGISKEKIEKNNVFAIDSTGNIEKFIAEKTTSHFDTNDSKMSCHLHYTMHVDTTCTHTFNRTRWHTHVLMTFSFPFNMLYSACKLEVYINHFKSHQIQCEFPVFQTTLIGQEGN